MDRWINGWVDGWVGRWINGWMDGWMVGDAGVEEGLAAAGREPQTGRVSERGGEYSEARARL